MALNIDLNHWLDKVWEALEYGSGFSRHPFHFPVMVTMNGTKPTGRTVVLRDMNESTRTLQIYTDLRAAKVRQLEENPETGLIFWDQQEGIQVRIQGIGKVIHPADHIDTLWESLKPESKLNYRTRLSPGTPVSSYLEAYQEVIPEAKENLGIIEVVITEIDWLKLSVEGHLRAQWKWNGSSFQGSWVVP